MYLHARYYDPRLGIFLSPDPIGVEGGTNLYGYGLGDPVNSSDRTGLDSSPCSYSVVTGISGTTNPSWGGPGNPMAGCSGGPYGGGGELAAGEAQYLNNLALSGHGGVYAYEGADGNLRFTMNPGNTTDFSADTWGNFVHLESGSALHVTAVYEVQRSASYVPQMTAVGATIGAGFAVGGSIVVDAATGGVNILATPAEVATGAYLGGLAGAALGTAFDYITLSKGGDRVVMPSWVTAKPRADQSGKDFAKEQCDGKYGKGNYNTGPGSEYNAIKKSVDRGKW